MAAERSNADLQEIQKAIGILFEPGRVVEVRAPHEFGCGSGYFDDYEQLATTIKRLSDDGRYQAVWVSLNVIDADILDGRSANIFLHEVESTTKKKDIVRRCWLFIDIDPKRPTDVSATNEEKAKAYEVMLKVRQELRALGWPGPLVATSGNGYHLLYRVNEYVDDTSSPVVNKLFKNVLSALADKFSTASVEIDTAVHDAGRVTKAYGTLARKGLNTPERPPLFQNT